MKANGDPTDASQLAISKWGRTNTESILSKEDSVKQGQFNAGNNMYYTKYTTNNGYQPSKYTKTDATRTDTKSYKQTYSRDNSISSGRSN